jgi:hypothetical protein
MIPANYRRAVNHCLASNAQWRRHAGVLRDHAAQPHPKPDARLRLLREAEAADHQADWWLSGAIEVGPAANPLQEITTTANSKPSTMKQETVNAVICALWSGIPQLSLLTDTDHPLALRKVRRGDIIDDPDSEIDDPDSEQPVEALRNGIYQRCLIARDGATGCRNAVDREAIGLDAACQAMQWTETCKRNLARVAA